MAYSEVPTASTEAIKFAFLSDEEVRQHSSLRVTDPSFLTQLGNPVAGGLYDKALGPIDYKPGESCGTCGEKSRNCPGHCGHIDLALPVYNPLLFNTLYKLLQRM
ncbi:DNA-directed RNA polymerase I subunit 1 [Pyrus x bretschneideri]|uniref:DNA-directed RNA polymerase I subunit 1 n=1 Tax=Pyrus x bretschneideri TaxID=225117 RepID=UPI000510EC9E|nr:DNA-directed RNA polymerase I subunit 1 [Pyrus x bretschneideri]